MRASNFKIINDLKPIKSTLFIIYYLFYLFNAAIAVIEYSAEKSK